MLSLVVALWAMAAAPHLEAANTARVKTQGNVSPIVPIGGSLLTPLSSPSLQLGSSLLSPSGQLIVATPLPGIETVVSPALAPTLSLIAAQMPAAQTQVPGALALPQDQKNQATASINAWSEGAAKDSGAGGDAALRLETLFTGQVQPSLTDPTAVLIQPAALFKGMSAEQRLKPYDFKTHALNRDDRIGLIISGFRFDEQTGQILTPGTKVPLTYDQLAKIQTNQSLGRRFQALERLRHLLKKPGAGTDTAVKEKIRKIVAEQKDALPSEVARAFESGDMDAFKAVVERRHYSLVRLYDHYASAEAVNERVKPLVRSAAETKDAYFDEKERQTGEAIQKQLIVHFQKNPEGAKLLEELRQADGSFRLPSIRVLKLDERYGAFYSPGRMEIVLSLDFVQRYLSPAMSPGEDFSDYVLKHPNALAAFFKAADITIFHEHVHFKQDLKGDYFREANRGNAVSVIMLENEHEAFFRQAVYLHHKLAADASALTDVWLDDYTRMLIDLEAWLKDIDTRYGNGWPHQTADNRTARELQVGRWQVLRRLRAEAGAVLEKYNAQRLGLWLGLQALKGDKALAEERLAAFRAAWPALRFEGLQRLAQLYSEKGQHHSALACLYKAWEGATGEQQAQLRPLLDKEVSEALAWASKDGVAQQARLDIVYFASRSFNALGKVWPLELWSLGASAYAKAAETNAGYARELEGWKVQIRKFVDDYLGSAAREKDAWRRASLFREALRHAKLIDGKLAKEVETEIEKGGPAGLLAFQLDAWMQSPDESQRPILDSAATKAIYWASITGASLEARLDVVWHASRAMNALGKTWPYELWALGLSAYTEAGKADPRYAQEALKWRGFLADYVKGFLTTAAKEADPRRRRSLIEAAVAHAKLTGDAKLIAEAQKALDDNGGSGGGFFKKLLGK